jgi:hypothetical protein
MTPSSTDALVVTTLRQLTSSTLGNLAVRLGISRRTVQRALLKHGYYTSCNRNGTYLTLRELPQFDAEGLWTHRKACFSAHGTLMQTVLQLVQASTAGKTVIELEGQLHTHVHNQLSWLLREGQLARFYWGRHTVYVSDEPGRAAGQRQQRLVQGEPQQGPPAPPKRSRPYPEGIRAEYVIRLLVQMIATPQASTASLAKKLQAEGIALHAPEVRRIVEFYALGKKTAR